MRFRLCLALAILIAAVTGLQAQTYTETVLHNFEYTDGAFPLTNLIQAHDGNFYGSSYTGGTNGAGAAYKISSSGSFTLLHSFVAATEGSDPTGVLVEGPDGNFYGTCAGGGAHSDGTVYKMSPSGGVTLLYAFTGNGDGSSPSPLVLGTDGNYWGTSVGGSNGGVGTIFKMTPAGGLTTMYAFPSDGSSGYDPVGDQLVQASNGLFYGTDTQTPPNEIILTRRRTHHDARPDVEPTPSFTDGGIIFDISTTGSFGLAYSYTSSTVGVDPNTSLVEGVNGDLYGEDFYSNNGYGDIYSFNFGTSAYTSVHNFSGGTDNGSPEGALFVGSDGNLYGTGSSSSVTSGSSGGGVVFKLVPSNNALTTIYTFGTQSGDGGNPDAGVTQGSDGALYGTNFDGGYSGSSNCDEFGCGDLYKISASPALAAPVQLTFSSGTTNPGSAVTLNWKVLNAFSDTMQLCYAYQSASGGGTTWTGKQIGTLSASTHLYTGSAQITPTADGTYTYSMTCGGQEAGSATLTVSGQPASVKITTASLPAAAVGTAYSTTLQATGGTAPYKWSVSTGTLPAGLTLGASTGVISGTPTATGTFSFTVKVQDSESTPETATANLSIKVAPATLKITTTSLAAGTVGKAYSATLTATGGTAPYTWSISSGSLPTGLTLAAGTGIISGTPTAAGTHAFTVAVKDSESTPQTTTAALSIVIAKVGTTSVLTASLNPVQIGQILTLTTTVKESSGSGIATGTVTFSVSGSSLATETLNGSGVATLTVPTSGLAAGTYSLTATFGGSTNANASTSPVLNVVVKPASTSTTLVLTPSTVTPPASVTMTATVKHSTSGVSGTPTGSVTFSVDGATLSTVNLNGSGVASFTVPTSGVTPGSYPIIAKYSGDSTNVASTSATETVVVK